MTAFGRLLCVFVLVGLTVGCNRGAKSAAVTGPPSPPGWEVRYNATVALARRGSDKVKEEHVWDNLVEMLDEEQQFRNFRRSLKDKTEVTDEAKAWLTVITALQAVDELHRRRPELDLSDLNPSVEKLAHSRNMAVSTEAKKTQQLLAAK